MKLTVPQLSELKKLAKGPQRTCGAARARVQNTLQRLGLAVVGADYVCRILPAGRAVVARAVLEEVRKR